MKVVCYCNFCDAVCILICNMLMWDKDRLDIHYWHKRTHSLSLSLSFVVLYNALNLLNTYCVYTKALDWNGFKFLLEIPDDWESRGDEMILKRV